jgi:hypothetical protein
MSSQGFISLYGPGWMTSSMSGFLLRANAALSLKPGIMSGKEPLAKGVLTLRGTSDESFAVQSSQRGMRTMQSQDLYSFAQSSQVRASEYCDSDTVSQATCASDFVKLS